MRRTSSEIRLPDYYSTLRKSHQHSCRGHWKEQQRRGL